MSVFMKILHSPVLDSHVTSSLARTKVQSTRKLCAGVYIREESEFLTSTGNGGLDSSGSKSN